MLRMGPEEFCRHTPRQIEMLCDAAAEQQKLDRHFQAVMTANLMNCQLAKGSRVTADELLEPPKQVRTKKTAKGYAEMGEPERAASLELIQERLRKRIELADGKQARTKTKAVR